MSFDILLFDVLFVDSLPVSAALTLTSGCSVPRPFCVGFILYTLTHDQIAKKTALL